MFIRDWDGNMARSELSDKVAWYKFMDRFNNRFKVDAAVEGLSSILEPLLIVVMGGMVGLIAASVIGPISSLANNI